MTDMTDSASLSAASSANQPSHATEVASSDSSLIVPPAETNTIKAGDDDNDSDIDDAHRIKNTTFAKFE